VENRHRQFFLTIFLSVFIDQFSKYLVAGFLSESGSLSIFRYFSLTLIRNKGICFGFLNNLNVKNIIIAASVIIAVGIFLYLEEYVKDKQIIIALGLIEGGIIGNLIDRIRIGAVIDFINFHIWPVFNFADTLIVVGVSIIFFHYFKRGRYVSGVPADR